MDAREERPCVPIEIVGPDPVVREALDNIPCASHGCREPSRLLVFDYTPQTLVAIKIPTLRATRCAPFISPDQTMTGAVIAGPVSQSKT